MKPCDYHGCGKPTHGPPPTDTSWHLCEGHQAEIEELVNRKPFSTKALVGWWARGTDKDKFVTELSDKMVKFMQGVKAIQESRK